LLYELSQTKHTYSTNTGLRGYGLSLSCLLLHSEGYNCRSAGIAADMQSLPAPVLSNGLSLKKKNTTKKNPTTDGMREKQMYS